MDKLLVILLVLTVPGVMIFTYPDGFTAVLFNSVFATAVFLLINAKFRGEEKIFLQNVFIVALFLRLFLATVTYVYELQTFFGGDSITYDFSGWSLYNYWFGNLDLVDPHYLSYSTRTTGSGWGMAYVVAAIYTIIGRNPFATQVFNCILGAATACLTYICAKNIFNNSRTAKISAVLVAVFPSLIIWSSQGLKDPIICFLLVLSINSVFSLQKSFNYPNLIILIISIGGIYALRFYIFFAFAVAIIGSFVLNTQKSVSSIIQQFAALVLLTIGLTYFGVLSGAQKNLEEFGNLERLQASRIDSARSAESGFGKDIDVSTSEGAVQILPIGLAYLMLAPFPWQVSNLRQSITLPEVLIWWTMIPFMLSGILYAVKNKFRNSIGVITFTLLLTVSYAIFQGNVGTAYRMRAQMQIFYFIFVAAGIVIFWEKRENRRLSSRLYNKF